MAETLDVTLLAHTRVQALDVAAQTVMTTAGTALTQPGMRIVCRFYCQMGCWRRLNVC